MCRRTSRFTVCRAYSARTMPAVSITASGCRSALLALVYEMFLFIIAALIRGAARFARSGNWGISPNRPQSHPPGATPVSHAPGLSRAGTAPASASAESTTPRCPKTAGRCHLHAATPAFRGRSEDGEGQGLASPAISAVAVEPACSCDRRACDRCLDGVQSTAP